MKRETKKSPENVRFLFRATFIFMVLALKICFVFGQKKVIVIDPGHGGMDSGAIGVNGIYEKDVVLKVAKEILSLNRTLFDSEFYIFLTRYKDTLISLSDRSRLAKCLNADVFISLHCNSFKAFSRGVEVYVHDSNLSYTKASIALGISILKECNQKLGFENRGVKFANFQVLRETIPYCPSILMEIGFMTNSDEANYYFKPKNIRAMALVVLMGIMNLFEF